MEKKAIQKFLEEYEDLWHTIDETEKCPLPVMDIGLRLIDEKDYYGCDFSGKNRVYELFFTGSSDYFPGIHIIKDIPLDECPIYLFELSSNGSNPKLIGNFKTYVETLLNYYIKNGKKKSAINEAKKALKKMEIFSSNLVKVPKYKLKIND